MFRKQQVLAFDESSIPIFDSERVPTELDRLG
jgi:hypothetical protein